MEYSASGSPRTRGGPPMTKIAGRVIFNDSFQAKDRHANNDILTPEVCQLPDERALSV